MNLDTVRLMARQLDTHRCEGGCKAYACPRVAGLFQAIVDWRLQAWAAGEAGTQRGLTGRVPAVEGET